MNLNRSQLSLVITSFSMAIVWVLAFTIHLRNVPEAIQGFEINLADKQPEEKLKEAEKEGKALSSPPSIKSHKAFNEAAKPAVSTPKPPEMPEEEETPQGNPGEEGGSATDFMRRLEQLAADRREKQQRVRELTAQKQRSVPNAKDRQTSVAYALADRDAYSLPTPVYRCIEGGKVVITVKVDANGYVTKADFDAKRSETRNGCLVDNAIAYALRARFSPHSESAQTGTITYFFQEK